MLNNKPKPEVASIESATVLEDFSYSAKVHITTLMCYIKKAPPKDDNNRINIKVLNDDDSFFQSIPDLITSNYYQIDNVGEGFKDNVLLIAFISEDINNIVNL